MSLPIGPDHDAQQELLGAYLLGALPPDERATMKHHLYQCATCAEEAERLQVAVDALPGAVSIVEPPLELKSRIMAVVKSEAQLLAAAGPEADRVPGQRKRDPRRRWSMGWSPVARPLATGFAALALVAAGVGGAALLGGDKGGSGTRTLAARVLGPTQASAKAELRTVGSKGTLVVRDFADPPRGHVWQLWLQAPGANPMPAGATFAVRNGEVAIPRTLAPRQRVMVTLEPEGGSTTPSTTPVIVTARV